MENISSCSNAFPVPIATQAKGSSAIWTGRPVSFDNLLSMFFNNAPPPVKVKPISTKSADNSGGVCSSAFLIPDTISFDQAAAAMLKGLTVRYLIKDSFEVKDHHTVLFHAAAGGVGLIAGQWMRVLGAKAIGTAGSDNKCNLAKQHGYEETINYSSEDFLEKVQGMTNQLGVDVVYDSVGKDTMFNSFKALKRHGTVVSFGQSSGAYTDLKMTDLAF